MNNANNTKKIYSTGFNNKLINNNNKNKLNIPNYNNIAAKGRNLKNNGYAQDPSIDSIFQRLFFNECVHLATMYKLNGNGNISTAKRRKVNPITPRATPMSADFSFPALNPTTVIPTNFRRPISSF
jgi:hypothetical protein